VIEELSKFTYDAYVNLLNFLRSRYRIVPFREVSKACEPFLILRHDVDGSLEAALEMARLEKDLGVSSTYFVLFSHKLYNLLEKDALNTVKEILKCGHEVGLHYEVESYESYGRGLEETLKKEVELLQYLLDVRVYSIACHNVSLCGDPFRDVDTGYINASDPELCELYVSDSSRAWCLEDLSRLLSFSCGRVQLLIHPFLWTRKACSRRVLLERLFQEVERRNVMYKRRWLRIWKNPKVKKYEANARRPCLLRRRSPSNT